MKFTQIPSDTYQKLVLNAGIICKSFAPSTATVSSSDIIGATSGGLKFEAVPTFKDLGEDVDNCPKNTKELKQIERIEAKATGSFVAISTAAAKSLMAAADIGTTDTSKVTPRGELKSTDFSDIWIVADYSDQNGDTNGGFVAIHLINALSTGGFKMQTADKEKGKFEFEYMAHYSLSAIDTVPYEVYVKAGTAEPTGGGG